MPRSGGTFTAPSNSVNPAVEGTTIDETDFNALVQDVEDALTESVYTGGLGSTDNQIVRTDGTDTKKVQGSGVTVDDSNNVSGVAGLSVTTINIGNADTTISRTGAGDIAVEGNAIYRAGGTDVPITDGGTGASTATAAFDALSPTTTQGDLIYHNGTNNVRLGAGTAGQVLQSGGAGANPSWASVAGTGDVVGGSASSDGEIALYSGTGGKLLKRSSTISGIAKLTSGVLSSASAGTDYYAPGSTDVAIADGGTGASTAAAGARALLEGIGSTQGDILYRSGTEWTALGAGTAGQVLQSGGAGANPAWASAGSGDVTAASAFGTDNRLLRSDGTGKGAQASAVTVDDSGNMSGVGTLAVGGAVSGVTTMSQSSYTDFAEIAAPSSPSANVARMYAVDVSTVTRMAMKDSAGVVSMLDVNHNMQVFTSSGTFTTPAHSSTKTVYRYVIVGAGGGGGGTNGNGAYASCGGGGYGGVVTGTFTGVAASTGITITIGSGGTAGTTSGGNGGNGGDSSIGTPVSVTAGGGVGATSLTPATATTPAASAGGAGGTASGGTINIAGMKGMNGGSPGYTAGVFAFFGGMGGSGAFGGGGTGGGGYVTSNGSAGTGYGAGGGGGVSTSGAGGAGSGGLVLIEWVL